MTELSGLTGLTGPKFENGITDPLTGLTCRDASASKKLEAAHLHKTPVIATYNNMLIFLLMLK